jgi:hypothetical protein
MPRSQRKLLFCIFSASILVTVVSIVHAVYLLGPSGLLEGLTANVEVDVSFALKISIGLIILIRIQCAISLIVANLAVVVTHIYRLLRNGEDIDRESYDNSAINATRVGLGGIKKLFNRAVFKPQVSSMHFASIHPQTRHDQHTQNGGETTMDTEASHASKPYHSLTFGTDMSDDRDRDEKPVRTWNNHEETGIFPNDNQAAAMPQGTIVAEERTQVHIQT